MKKAILIFSLILFIFPVVSVGQDFHFTQAYLSPLTLNPATTGNFSGDYRAICNYKDQWSSISKLYKTIFASADFVAFKKKKEGNYLGVGLTFFNDKAGKSKMGTNQINLSVAYNIKLNKTNFLAAGLQFGYAQKSVNTNNQKWDNQYDGTAYNSSLASGETNFVNQVNYADFGAGLLWNFIPDENNRLAIGVSILHVNKPNQSFSKLDKDPLNAKIVIHADAQIKIGEKKAAFIPIVLFTNQGKLNEINVGGLVKYGSGLDSKYTGANKSSSVSFGALYRLKDAFAILVNMEYKKMITFGVSYDINVSSLAIASKGRGGLELCIVYSGLLHSKK